MNQDPVHTGDLSQALSRRWLALILLSSLVLNALPVWWGLPSFQGWAVDEILPRQVRQEGAWPEKYPPLHRDVLRSAHIPVEALHASGLIPGPANQLQTLLFLTGRCLSVLLATATVYLVYRSGRILGSRQASLLAAGATAVLPPLVYYAKTVNLEAPFLFWFACSVFFYLKLLRQHRMRDYLLFFTLATLSVATKDQAYGVYLLSPLVIAWSLSRREPRGEGALRSFLVALGDRRLLAGLGAAFASFTLVYRGGLVSEAFWQHVRVMTGDQAVGQYRSFANNLEGYLALAWQSLENLWFALSPPFFLAALAGLVLALGRRSEHGHLLSLLIFPISYQIFFVSVIGYNYVRFQLPACIIACFFVGMALAQLLRIKRVASVWRAVAVSAVFLVPFSWAVAVDLLMLGDPRYAAEEWAVEQWAEEGGAKVKILGLGRAKMLPRGIKRLEWKTLKDRECEILAREQADFLLINDGDPRTWREVETVRTLAGGWLGYEEARRFENRFPFNPFAGRGVNWNLDKIGRALVTLGRSGEECFDAKVVARIISELHAGQGSIDRKQLAGWLLEERILEIKSLAGKDIVVAGLSRDWWTRGTRPAAVAIRNSSSTSHRPFLSVATGPEGAPFPVTVYVDDGHEVTSTTFDQPGQQTLELSAISPGSIRLYLVWSDIAWAPHPGSRRRLGIRLGPEAGLN